MRAIVLVLALTACASSGSAAVDPSVTLRKADPAPEAVLDARAHTVAVYINVTCATLDQADPRTTGFYLTPRIVVTAGHAMDVRTRLFPDFALVGPDGCRDGQYGDWSREADILFILARGRHEGHLELAERLPNEGETLYQYVFQGRNDVNSTAVFIPLRIQEEDLRESSISFGSTTPPSEGDSGAPVLDADGKAIGMTIAVGRYKDDPTHRTFGVHLSSLAIRYFFSQCAPCEEE